MDEIEKKLDIIEHLFEKYGAMPLEINKKNREKFGERRIFFFHDNYYRVGRLVAEDQGDKYMVISCIDNEKYADIGMLEDVEAIPFSADEAELEKQVRYIFGIEPYPKDYYL